MKLTEEQFKALMAALSAPIRILLMAAFLLLAKMGWFTWLTPENHADRVNAVMDFIVVAVPVGYAAWALTTGFFTKLAEAKAKEPIEMVRAVAALPQVGRIVTTPEIANAIPDPTVVSGTTPYQPIN